MSENIASNFIKLCEGFDLIHKTYVRIVPRNQSSENYPKEKKSEYYLFTHLFHWVMSFKDGSSKSRSELDHFGFDYNGDGRRQLPSTILGALSRLGGDFSNWKDSRKKVVVYHVSAYLKGVRPDKKKKGWESLECSHRCVSYGFSKSKRCLGLYLEAPNYNKDSILSYGCCMIWENKLKNINRGHTKKICIKVVNGTRRHFCQEGEFHDPPCL